MDEFTFALLGLTLSSSLEVSSRRDGLAFLRDDCSVAVDFPGEDATRSLDTEGAGVISSNTRPITLPARTPCGLLNRS
jgi:hypothetical protein